MGEGIYVYDRYTKEIIKAVDYGQRKEELKEALLNNQKSIQVDKRILVENELQSENPMQELLKDTARNHPGVTKKKLGFER